MVAVTAPGIERAAGPAGERPMPPRRHARCAAIKNALRAGILMRGSVFFVVFIMFVFSEPPASQMRPCFIFDTQEAQRFPEANGTKVPLTINASRVSNWLVQFVRGCVACVTAAPARGDGVIIAASTISASLAPPLPRVTAVDIDATPAPRGAGVAVPGWVSAHEMQVLAFDGHHRVSEPCRSA